MDFDISWQYVKDMTAEEYKAFSHTGPRNGYLAQEIRDHRSRPAVFVRKKPAIGIMAHQTDPNRLGQHPDRLLLGAALLVPYAFLVYVKHSWRMMGVGTAILDEATRLANLHDYNLDSSVLKLP